MLHLFTILLPLVEGLAVGAILVELHNLHKSTSLFVALIIFWFTHLGFRLLNSHKD